VVARSSPRQYVAKLMYTVPAVASGSTDVLMSVPKGTRILSVSILVKVASAGTTSTIAIGDGTASGGFLAATDADATAAGTMVDGAGTMLANAGGRLYLVDDTIDATYVTGATPGATAPVWEIRIRYYKEW
jgi:hypothetical protein